MSKKIVIIGGGPGGYVAAIRAAQLKNEVTLIEKDELGGTCSNRGCVPTKALIKSANTFWETKKGDVLGIRIKGASLDFQAVIKRKERVVKQLVNGIQFLMKKNKVKVIKGIGTIVDPKTVRIVGSNEQIKADNIVIATGSVPSSIHVEGTNSAGVINSDEALKMQELPQSVVIIGGGMIGIEFAQIMYRMGVSVTVIEMMPQILPSEDTELAQILEGMLRQEGIEIFTNATVKKIRTNENGGKAVSYTTKDGSNEKLVDKVLVAVGRIAETSDLGLDKIGIHLDNKKYIVVNDKMQTNIRGIYSVGDVIGGIMLAHTAMAEGKCAVNNIAGMSINIDYRTVPRCIYTSPEMACVGLTEARAKEKYGSDIVLGRFPLVGNSRTAILEEGGGLVKIIAEKRYREILGIQILGPHATELVGEAVLGMHLEATIGDFADAIHAHPTISEAIMEAALSLEGKAIHI